MRFTMPLIIVGALGLVAAIAAALLLAALRVRSTQSLIATASPDTTVLVAAHDLYSLSLLTGDMIDEKTMPRKEAPSGFFTDKSQLVGKVIGVPVAQGQAFTRNLLVAEGSGAHLAGILPKGMRAVTISVANYAGLEGLLYPGSVVDVLAAFELPKGDAGEALSTNLIENVQVLAVENLTVGAQPSEEDQSQAPRGRSDKLMATLMVSTKQAEALQLAMEYGVVSFALRNPSDDVQAGGEPTLLSGGQLAALAEVMAARVRAEEEAAEAAKPVEPVEMALPPELEPVEPEPKPTLEIKIIRGPNTEVRTFEIPAPPQE